MRFRFTIALLLLNVFAFGTIIYLDRRGESDTRALGGLTSQIAQHVADADRLEIRWRRLDAPRVLERTGQTWNIIEPVRWTANFFAVNRILNQLQFLEEEAAFSISEVERTGQTLADYDLEDPSMSITITTDGRDMTLAIGAPTEIGNNIYLLGPDRSRVFVINRSVVADLTVDVNDLRNREIFDVPVFEIDTLSLSINDPSTSEQSSLRVRLTKSDNTWSFEAPLNASADPALVTGILNELSATKAIRFIEPEAINLALQGLENPTMQVTLHGNRRRQTILIGALDNSAREPSFFAKLEGNPTVFTVPANVFNSLKESQEALRERNFVNFDPASISGIDISEGDLRVRLQQLETGAWQIIESESGGNIRTRRADSTTVNHLLSRLREIRAVNFTADAPSSAALTRLGFDTPRRTVRLLKANTPDLEVWFAHPEDENQRMYARTNEQFVYEVPRRALINLLPLNPLHYRERILERLPSAARITQLSITKEAGDGEASPETLLDLAINPDSETWALKLEEKPPHEKENILNLIDHLRTLEVDRYVRDSFIPENVLDESNPRPWAYRLAYTVALPGGESSRIEERALLISERLGGNLQSGTSEYHRATFFLKPDFIETFGALIDPIEPLNESTLETPEPAISVPPIQLP